MPRTNLTTAEKERRKHERKAASLTAASAKDFGPLFAHMAPTFTPTDAYWQWRRNVAEGVERLHVICNGGAKALRVVLTAWIEHHARPLCGEHFDELKVYAVRVFRDYHGHAYGFWERVLTGGEVVYGWRPNPSGKGVVPERVCRLDPAPMTVGEFRARFPFAEPPEGPEPDDGGLFERTIGRLGRVA